MSKREGVVQLYESPESVLDAVMDQIEEGQVKHLAVVYLHENGTIVTGWSMMNKSDLSALSIELLSGAILGSTVSGGW